MPNYRHWLHKSFMLRPKSKLFHWGYTQASWYRRYYLACRQTCSLCRNWYCSCESTHIFRLQCRKMCCWFQVMITTRNRSLLESSQSTRMLLLCQVCAFPSSILHLRRLWVTRRGSPHYCRVWRPSYLLLFHKFSGLRTRSWKYRAPCNQLHWVALEKNLI